MTAPWGELAIADELQLPNLGTSQVAALVLSQEPADRRPIGFGM